MNFAEIILPLNLEGTFTYEIPSALKAAVLPGMRVLVPFRGRKVYTGVVFSVHGNPPENFKPKEIISVLDSAPILPPEQLKFWEWLADYYLSNLGEIYRFAFPASLKLESETYLKLKPGAEIDYALLDSNEIYLLQALEVRQMVNLSDIEAFIPKKEIIKTINSLIDLEYIEVDEKIAERYQPKEVAYIGIKNLHEIKSQIPEILLSLKRSPRQQDLFLKILEFQTATNAPARKSEIFAEGNFGNAHLKGLIDKGLAEEFYLVQDRINSYTGELEAAEMLSAAQQEVLMKIDESFSLGKNVLLHGVTSSGKTHLYLKKIEDCIHSGKTALLLVPEISLTKQISSRLEKKFGSALAYYHSKLSDFEKIEIWKKIRHNDVKLLIGTRQSLFLPFQNLGLIIVDEEHDASYRPRDVSPNFHARDAALVLADLYRARAILGSATPSVESYYAAQMGKLEYIFLGQRFGGTAEPKVQLIDFKQALDTKAVRGDFSEKLLGALAEKISEKKQSIVLHNRRGFATVVECAQCGYVAYCSNCDVVMAYHKEANEMKCHYCGQRAAKPVQCPKCLSEQLLARGVGVEQIQEKLIKIFPEASVERMDVDSMRKKFAYEKLYEKISTGEADIIVGTQMITKGLDFANIDLVGIPRADHLLYVQNFRAEERAYQLITQAAGRAGRKSGKGEVLIQTYNPQHSVFRLIMENNYSEIYNYFLTERKNYHYPPFTKMIMIELKHRKEEKNDRAAKFLGSVLRNYLPDESVLGPEKAPIPKINTLYHNQILLKLPRGRRFHMYRKMLRRALAEFREVTAYQSIKLSLTVDY
ncbi:replication restart DNA helicase PriA [Cruoricaptor ignavus]|uniref:Replication restart protein PriA n=1 Tax=Cruoricaptor ignavus TaxID=1118202 RepID=A0A1M6C5U4_9FLAO|nr:primosomal protein N' [Cruoricaptor ignavus]SHI56417.1 replication restart DNA helicase PriA [Cruoricaptor ignavus]